MIDRGGRARWLLVRALLIWAGWTLFALFSASQNFLSRAYQTNVEWTLALLFALLDSYVWAVLTPPVLLLAGWLPLERRNWWWRLPLYLGGSILFAVVHLNVFVGLLPWIGYPNTPRVMQSLMLTKFHSNLLTCWALLGLRHAADYYRKFRERELKASQLQAQLALAQLQVLKVQLQPHFLFNTLHAISALVYKNPDAADRMIARLSDFLRLTLDALAIEEVPLRHELEFLNKYLEIEQVRFGDRLEVRNSIEADTLDLLVPNLLLQPLVENAVRHGIGPRAAGGRIEVRSRREGNRLILEIEDNGAGVGGMPVVEGVGLSNTRARLRQLYGDAGSLAWGTTAGGGFRATLALPARPAEASACAS